MNLIIQYLQKGCPSDAEQIIRIYENYCTKVKPINLATLNIISTLFNYHSSYSSLATNQTHTYLNTYLYKPPLSFTLSDMDTSSTTAKKTIRANLTAQYDARVASTLEKVDPNRAKAKAALGQDDHIEVESMEGEWGGYKDPLPSTSQEYSETPLLTLRELMPGATGGDDKDPQLDQSFRADRIEFIVTRRKLTKEENEVDMVLKDAADVDWSIPDAAEFEDIMGNAMDIYTDERPELVHALSWSSVGAATGVGCFSVRTGRMSDFNDIRGTLRTIIVEGWCFESFPKKALMESYSLTAIFPACHEVRWHEKTCNVAPILQQGPTGQNLACGGTAVHRRPPHSETPGCQQTTTP